jgi:formate dehydrogenase major subunit
MSMEKQVLYINNEEVQFEPGQTLLSIIKERLGEDSVPTLCDAPNLKPFGSCRVCSVEVALQKDGPTKVQASCHTPAMANSYVYTHSEKVNRLRKNIVELVLTDYPAEKFETDNPKNNELNGKSTL